MGGGNNPESALDIAHFKVFHTFSPYHLSVVIIKIFLIPKEGRGH